MTGSVSTSNQSAEFEIWGVLYGEARAIIYLIIRHRVRLLCKQNGMQITFVCFFPRARLFWLI